MADEREPEADEPEQRRPKRRDDEDDRPRRRDDRDERPTRRDERDDYDERPRRRREPEIAATDFLIPTDVSRYSMAACYLGLFSCFIPLLGFLMALVAVLCGIKALRQRKKDSASYGAVTGDIRAILGLICATVTIVSYLVLAILILTDSLK